jgi:uncharacterized membrane protein YgaE (UPF0421/DUF939 family)
MFAAIAAMVSMGSSIEDSVKTGWNRIVGTVIGGVSGLVGIFICNMIPFDWTYVIIIPIGIMGLIYVCNNLKKPGAIIICCVMFISVITTYPQEFGSYVLAIMRLLETGFGVIVAFLVNRFIKVPECKENSKQKKALLDTTVKVETITVENNKKSRHKNKLNLSSIMYMIFKD